MTFSLLSPLKKLKKLSFFAVFLLFTLGILFTNPPIASAQNTCDCDLNGAVIPGCTSETEAACKQRCEAQYTSLSKYELNSATCAGEEAVAPATAGAAGALGQSAGSLLPPKAILQKPAPSTRPGFALKNPLGSNASIPQIIGNVVSAMLAIAGAATLVMFVWGGIQMVISQGDPGKITKGKNTLIWAVIGLVIIFTAYALVTAIINTLSGGTI